MGLWLNCSGSDKAWMAFSNSSFDNCAVEASYDGHSQFSHYHHSVRSKQWPDFTTSPRCETQTTVHSQACLITALAGTQAHR